jgi:hypothetical protein
MDAELKIGETYAVEHERKGKFKIKVTEFDKDFVHGIMVDGFADAIHDCNKKYVGDQIVIAQSHAKFFAFGVEFIN